MNTNKQRVLIVALFFLLTGSCAAYAAIDLPVRAGDQADYMMEGSVERGALLYANNCRTCHGNQGEGFVGPQLNVAEWRNQDPVVLAENQHMLTRTLNCGRAGTLMPAWLDDSGGSLNERQIEHLVNFLTEQEHGEEYLDQFGAPTSKGWVEALEFAHNLNTELTAVIGGDTLSIIADQHGIGVGALAEANNTPLENANDLLDRGTRVQLPANSDHPDGFTYQVRSDNDTIAKLANQLNVGAAIIADLNGIQYELDYDSGSFTLIENGEEVPGLLVGTTLELPEGATYRVLAGNTLESIAEQHGVSASDIRGLNENLLEGVEDDTELDGRFRLDLPENPTVTVTAEDTVGIVAAWYDLDANELADANEIGVDDTLADGQVLTLPAESRYIVQELDTLGSIAERHGVDEATLQQLNAIESPALFSNALILRMPKVDSYAIAVQTLEDAAAGFGNVTASTLADANEIEVDAPLRVGTVLELPEAAYGTAPPEARNPGTGCVQFAVSDSAYQEILGVTAFDPQDAPEEFTEDLTIQAHANDWTIPDQTPNEGVVKVRPGTVASFTNEEPVLHTVTIEGETLEPNFGPSTDATFEFEFVDEGRYYITCDYHPDMRAWVFVENE